MALSLCRGDCWRDRDTGEIFCPRVNDWVMVSPKEEVREICAEIETQRYQTSFPASQVLEWRDRILAAVREGEAK